MLRVGAQRRALCARFGLPCWTREKAVRRPRPKSGPRTAVPVEALRFRAMVCLFALMQKGTRLMLAQG
jgi:hypothetical protein